MFFNMFRIFVVKTNLRHKRSINMCSALTSQTVILLNSLVAQYPDFDLFHTNLGTFFNIHMLT